MTETRKRAKDQSFLFGLLWSAWWLHASHHEDTLAAWLLAESGVPATTFQRLARENDYQFARGFWKDVKR